MSRVDLFRLLGDEDRLRLLALCAENELTVGELATLLGTSQPQITKKSHPLREAGLLAARRDGTRTLLKSEISEGDAIGVAILQAGLAEGHTLCSRDGSLARAAALIAQREEDSRRFFDDGHDALERALPAAIAITEDAATFVDWLPALAPLLPGRALAVDLGTGDGTLLPLLSPLYERVVAVDRSASRLAQCAARIAAWGLPNVRLREGDADDSGLAEDIAARGGADLVAMARVLHHVARPDVALVAAARLVKRGGHLVVVDYLPHEDEAMRDQGDVWLGFPPGKLAAWFERAELEVVVLAPYASLAPRSTEHPPRLLAVGRKPMRPN
ncbi:MAG: methyltransferase domain-containing protein [Proteobacteria bacterium]|nr:methyltransferase domain-containing protein [Pseudomonadota bacterium]